MSVKYPFINPSEGFMKVQPDTDGFRVYKCKIPFHKPFRWVHEKVDKCEIPFHKPFGMVYARVLVTNDLLLRFWSVRTSIKLKTRTFFSMDRI